MVRERGIGMGRQLGDQRRILRGRNDGGPTGWRAWCNVAGRAAACEPAFDRTRADLKGGNYRRAGHPTVDGIEHAFSEIR